MPSFISANPSSTWISSSNPPEAESLRGNMQLRAGQQWAETSPNINASGPGSTTRPDSARRKFSSGKERSPHRSVLCFHLQYWYGCKLLITRGGCGITVLHECFHSVRCCSALTSELGTVLHLDYFLIPLSGPMEHTLCCYCQQSDLIRRLLVAIGSGFHSVYSTQ